MSRGEVGWGSGTSLSVPDPLQTSTRLALLKTSNFPACDETLVPKRSNEGLIASYLLPIRTAGTAILSIGKNQSEKWKYHKKPIRAQNEHPQPASSTENVRAQVAIWYSFAVAFALAYWLRRWGDNSGPIMNEALKHYEFCRGLVWANDWKLNFL